MEKKYVYEYKVKLLKVVDGDTVDFMFDLGFNIKIKLRIRLARINTPELRGKEKKAGLAAKKFVRDMLESAQEIIVKTTKQGKYGRYLGEIYYKVEGDNSKFNLNDLLLEDGYAKEVKY